MQNSQCLSIESIFNGITNILIFIMRSYIWEWKNRNTDTSLITELQKAMISLKINECFISKNVSFNQFVLCP